MLNAGDDLILQSAEQQSITVSGSGGIVIADDGELSVGDWNRDKATDLKYEVFANDLDWLLS